MICAEEASRPNRDGDYGKGDRLREQTRKNQSVEEKEMKKPGRILGLALLFCLLAGLTAAGAMAEEQCKDGHTPGKKVKEEVVEATCEKEGSYEVVEYCTVCKKELSREKVTVKAKGHKWGKWKTWRKPTCTRPGERRRICERNPKHIDKEEIEALGHLWNPWEVDTEATIDAPGSESRCCRRDGEHIQTREIPQVGSVQITETKRMDLLELMAWDRQLNGENLLIKVRGRGVDELSDEQKKLLLRRPDIMRAINEVLTGRPLYNKLFKLSNGDSVSYSEKAIVGFVNQVREEYGRQEAGEQNP